ncbi:hypothetical protein ONZ45_g15877 [Pleurotus djamor]|nr:hypothetical protein ONZ45_g15877 [Pleurotus djamor]
MDTISSSAIQQLKSLYPATVPSLGVHHPGSNPWYLIAAMAFNAVGRPEAIVPVYNTVLEDLRAHSSHDDVDVDDHVMVVQKLQEALLKASLIHGIPRAVTAMSILNGAVPKSILEKLSTPLRDFDRPFSAMALHGNQFLREAFGEVGGSKVQDLLKTCSPDIATFMAGSYSLVLSHSSILTLHETSSALVAVSILDDFPRGARWTYLAAMQLGVTIDEMKAIREIALKVASLSNLTLREKVPEVVAQELLEVY